MLQIYTWPLDPPPPLFPVTPFTCVAASPPVARVWYLSVYSLLYINFAKASLTVCGSIESNAYSMSIATYCNCFFCCSASVMFLMLLLLRAVLIFQVQINSDLFHTLIVACIPWLSSLLARVLLNILLARVLLNILFFCLLSRLLVPLVVCLGNWSIHLWRLLVCLVL